MWRKSLSGANTSGSVGLSWIESRQLVGSRGIAADCCLFARKRGGQTDLSVLLLLIWVRHLGNDLNFAILSTLVRLIWFDHGCDRTFKLHFAVIAPV